MIQKPKLMEWKALTGKVDAAKKEANQGKPSGMSALNSRLVAGMPNETEVSITIPACWMRVSIQESGGKEILDGISVLEKDFKGLESLSIWLDNTLFGERYRLQSKIEELEEKVRQLKKTTEVAS